MATNRSGSLLAADFGSVHTRVLLIDVVDGVYHLVAQGEARTTAGYPIADVSVGFDRAVTDLSEKTKRKLVGEAGRLIVPERTDRSGVDYFVATASLGRPLQTAVIGLIPDLSIASALRAASGTYINIVQTVSLDDGRTEEDRLNAIVLSRPDLILITGGTEKGARNAVLALAKIARLAITVTDPNHKPAIVYAGNSALHEPLQALFGKTATVFLAENVHPSLDEEDLESAQAQLGRAFDEFKEKHGEGFMTVSAVSNVGVLPTAQSYALVAEYLCRTQRDSSVLLVDVGSTVSVLATGVDRRATTSIRTDIGLGHSVAALLQTVGAEAVRRWLPFYSTDAEITNYALNKTLRPASVPATPRDLYLEHGLLRAGIQNMVAASGQAHQHWDRVIGAGSGLTRTGSKGYAAMLLLDALQPEGIVPLYADSYGLIPALGAAAGIMPTAVVQMLEGRDLERLGTAIVLSGEPKPGKPAIHAKFIIEREVFNHSIEGGHLWVLPLGAGKQITVDVRVSGRGLHIGGKRRVKMVLEGGAAGLIFDARGRPLPLAADPRGLAAQLPMWVSEVTGDPLVPIDESWLVEGADLEKSRPQPPDRAELQKAARAAKTEKPRRSLFRRGGKEKAPAAREAAPGGEPPMPDFDDQPEEHDELDDLRREISK